MKTTQTYKPRRTLVRGVDKFKNKSIDTSNTTVIPQTANLNDAKARSEFIPLLTTTKPTSIKSPHSSNMNENWFLWCWGHLTWSWSVTTAGINNTSTSPLSHLFYFAVEDRIERTCLPTCNWVRTSLSLSSCPKECKHKRRVNFL